MIKVNLAWLFVLVYIIVMYKYFTSRKGIIKIDNNQILF